MCAATPSSPTRTFSRQPTSTAARPGRNNGTKRGAESELIAHYRVPLDQPGTRRAAHQLFMSTSARADRDARSAYESSHPTPPNAGDPLRVLAALGGNVDRVGIGQPAGALGMWPTTTAYCASPSSDAYRS